MEANQNEDQEQKQELYEDQDNLERGLRILARMIVRAHLEKMQA